MRRWLAKLKGDQRGATSVEYALITALIFLGMIAGWSALSNEVRQLWIDTANTLVQAFTSGD